jgi:hypothetical protein
MRPYHLLRTLAVVAVVLGTTAAPSAAATRVAPKAGALYVGTATEDGLAAGGLSVRVGTDGASLVSLLGGRFHGDLCTTAMPMFAGPGGIDPLVVTLSPDGRFSGTQVTAGLDGSRIASSLHGVFSASAKSATATLGYSLTPVSGVTPCTVTAKLSLHLAPSTPTGKVTPPRNNASYHVVTHQGLTGTVVTDKKGKRASLIQLAAWDVCHYTDLPTAHFLYPEHVRLSAAIAHGKLAVKVRYTGGSGSVLVAVTGSFVGAKHQLAGALHLQRKGTVDGNAFSCDTSRVLFSAP